MPELPEVHTVSSDLNIHITDWVIKEVQIFGTYRVLPSPEAFKKHLLNHKVKGVSRIAKNINIMLESGNSLVIHLAMTGQVLLREAHARPDKFVRVILTIEKAGTKKHIRYCDMRMFGKIGVVGSKGLQALKDKYGPEPVNPATTPEEFYNKIKSKRTNIKNALLDQEIVSGLGNIYATDTLFLSGVHPETSTTNITPQLGELLLNNARLILLEGISHRGSTLGDKMYLDIFGNSGTHQNYFRIYGKDFCPTCNTPTSFIKLNGRGTYFCQICQPEGGQKRLI